MNQDGIMPLNTSTENRFQYNGKELEKDGGIDLSDYGARWYDASIGRFTGVDPIADEFAWVSPFNYAENEPVGHIDLWGLQRVKVNGNYLRKQRNVVRRKIAEAGAYLRSPTNISRVGTFEPGSVNISSVSARTSRHVAENKNMTTGIGSERNAFRHVFWSAKMTQEMSVTRANEIGKAHEGIGAYDKIDVKYDEAFKGTALGADSVVDLLNNMIGQSIGGANPDVNNTALGIAVLNEFKEKGFFIVTTDEEGNVIIVRQKLSEEQYNNAVESLNNLDQNGFSEDERS